jgi:hypothetical protein
VECRTGVGELDTILVRLVADREVLKVLSSLPTSVLVSRIMSGCYSCSKGASPTDLWDQLVEQLERDPASGLTGDGDVEVGDGAGHGQVFELSERT